MLALIEDSQPDVEFYKYTFLKDMQFVHFATMEDFLQSTLKFSVVLTDLNLPDSWGLDTVRSIRAFTKADILVLTGTAGIYLTGIDHHNMVAAGANDVFEKNKIGDSAYADKILQRIKESYD